MIKPFIKGANIIIYSILYIYSRLFLHYIRVTYIKVKMKHCRFTGTNVNRA